MTHSCRVLRWGLGIAAVALSPIVVIFAPPVAIGVACDICDAAGGAAVTLALSGAVALMLLGRMLRRGSVRQAIAALSPPRLHLGRPARPH